VQGCEFAAAAWESEVLPRRVARYSPEYLDDLCLAGEVTGAGSRRIRLSIASRRREQEPRRVRPTRVAPLAIFLREDSPWLLAAPQPSPTESLSHPAREVLAAIESHGASFFTDLTRATGRLASEVEDALWELVAAGLVTADGFENLRALLDPKRRAGQGRERAAAAAARARALGAAAPRPASAPMGHAEPSRASCCCAGAWCSAMLAARETVAPPGAICWCRCAAWKRAARSAAAGLSKPIWASSSRCPRRSTCCAPFAAREKPGGSCRASFAVR
jgi:ATP-dependent helicase Lhr and Lhr-like helicase